MFSRARVWEPGVTWANAIPGVPRVLVEASDGAERWAAEGALSRAGYNVMSCGGPDDRGGPCPLATRGECDLALGADIVVNSFRLQNPDNADVLRALLDHTPNRPVIVEIANAEATAHDDLLKYCHLLPFPATRRALLTSVAQVLERSSSMPGASG